MLSRSRKTVERASAIDPLQASAQPVTYAQMLRHLSNPYVQVALALILLLCGFAIEPVVTSLRRYVDTKLIGELMLGLSSVAFGSVIVGRALRQGQIRMRGVSAARSDDAPLFWTMLVSYGLLITGGLFVLVRLLIVGE